MKPDVDADTLLFNMYVDFHRFIDNSDNVITLETLKRRTERAMQMDWDNLLEYCDYEIGYWRDHKHKFILHPDLPYKQSQIRSITKEVHYSEIDSWYDRSRSVKENLATHNESKATLYRYCSNRGIPTNPAKTMTEAQRREASREAKTDMKAQFMHLYDPSLSAPKNLEIMKQNGIDISEGTVRNWGKDYIEPNMPSDHPEPQAPLLGDGELPKQGSGVLDGLLKPIDFKEHLQGWKRNSYLAEMDEKWRQCNKSQRMF